MPLVHKYVSAGYRFYTGSFHPLSFQDCRWNSYLQILAALQTWSFKETLSTFTCRYWLVEWKYKGSHLVSHCFLDTDRTASHAELFSYYFFYYFTYQVDMKSFDYQNPKCSIFGLKKLHVFMIDIDQNAEGITQN